MPQVLYRKYRSRNFSEIFGQDAIKNILSQAIKDKRVAHAYLFSGPRGTGKTSTARILAKALNCLDRNEDSDFEPCNQCPNCIAINQNKFLDLIEIDAASNRGIDEIRQLKERVGFLPVEGKYKIYIIDEVHMLTLEAFNALLKTLEEPPINVLFILATTEPHKIPLTIISRTQRLDFKLALETELSQKIQFILKNEGLQFSDEIISMITTAGAGSFRDTETILEKVIASTGYSNKEVIAKATVEKILGMAALDSINEIFLQIQQKDSRAALLLLRGVFDNGSNITQLIRQILEFLRREMLTIIEDEGKSRFSLTLITQGIKAFSQAANEIQSALIPELALEMAVVNLTGINSPIYSSDLPVKKIEKVELLKTTAINKNVEDNITKTEFQVKKIENKSPDVSVDIVLVKDKWLTIIETAKNYNHHLAAFLSKAEPLEINESELKVNVPFALHKKTLEQPSSQDKFFEITKSLLGQGLTLNCIIDKSKIKLVQNQEIPIDVESNSSVVEEVFADL
ncbi:MAG: DNA polymerase III subunit gamma/tau [bacterium]